MSKNLLAHLRRHASEPRLILFVGWLVFLVYCYPGFMSTDSASQLFQGRGIEPRSDWHPPLMGATWGVLDRVVSGPFLMLVLQSCLFLGGLYGIFARVTSKSWAAVLSIAVLLFPSVVSVMAVIWKDSLMAGVALAGTSALLSTRRHVQVGGLVLLTIAAALRANAGAAVIPLVAILMPVAHLRGGRRAAVAGLISAVMVAGTVVANNALVEQKQYPWHNSVAILDLVGVIGHVRASDDEILGHIEATKPKYRTELRFRARHVYDPRAHWYTTRAEEAIFELPTTESERAAIEDAWLALVTTYPRAYAYHRWKVFREVIGYSDNEPFSSVYTKFTENEAQAYMLAHSPRRSWLQNHLNETLHEIEDSWVFRPYMYLAIGIALLFFLRGVPRPALALLVSGFVYELSLAVAAPSADYRYSHWMIVCVIVAALLVFVERLKRGMRIGSTS